MRNASLPKAVAAALPAVRMSEKRSDKYSTKNIAYSVPSLNEGGTEYMGPTPPPPPA